MPIGLRPSQRRGDNSNPAVALVLAMEYHKPDEMEQGLHIGVGRRLCGYWAGEEDDQVDFPPTFADLVTASRPLL